MGSGPLPQGRGLNKTATRKPARSRLGLLHQLCNLIPAHLVPRLAREHGVEEKSRTYSPWSHVVSLLFAQLTEPGKSSPSASALTPNPAAR